MGEREKLLNTVYISIQNAMFHTNMYVHDLPIQDRSYMCVHTIVVANHYRTITNNQVPHGLAYYMHVRSSTLSTQNNFVLNITARSTDN